NHDEADADHFRAPAILNAGKIVERRGIDPVRKIEEAERQDEPGKIGNLDQMLERAEGVGALPVEPATMLAVERFRQDEHAIAEVDEGEARRGEEGPARIELA